MLFSALFEKKLLAVTGEICGIILSHDWPIPMQLIVKVAKSHNIPVFLATHEAIFAYEHIYYTDKWTGQNIPLADHSFVWSEFQKDLFVSRGYPEDRMSVVGSHLLRNAQAADTSALRKAGRGKLAAHGDQRIITYIAQHLDNVPDPNKARDAQIEMIRHLSSLCERHHWRLIVRLPPACHPGIILGRMETAWPKDRPFEFIDADRTDLSGWKISPRVIWWLVLQARCFWKPACWNVRHWFSI